MNNFLLIVAAFLVLVLGALFAVPPLVNWNDFRGAFEEEVSRLLDREVRVRGDVNVRLLPMPYVSFEKVRIADAPGVPGSFARAERFKMWLSVPPLLRGIFEARQIELQRPVIRLRTLRDGTGNWSQLRLRPSGLAYIPSDVTLNSVRITDATVVFETYKGHKILKLADISGEMTASALTGPYKFIGTLPISGKKQELRLTTARAESNGDVRFSGSVRAPDNGRVHTINGTLHDLLGPARVVGRLISRGKPAKRANAATPTTQVGYELTTDLSLTAKTLRLDNIAISFQNKDRQQTMTGKMVITWREGLVTETSLAARWLDLDAIAGTAPSDGPLRAVEQLLGSGFTSIGVGVTSVSIKIDQANLAGTSVSDLTGRMVRRDGVTKVEALRVSLPGLTALAVDGFIEYRDNDLQFDGSMLVSGASLTELGQWFRADFGAASKRALATSFSLNSNIRVRPKRVELSDTVLRLAGTVVEGTARYDWSGRPSLVADIDAEEIALERFGDDLLLPANVAAFMGLSTRAKSPWLRNADVKLRLRAKRITDNKRTLANVNVDFDRDDDTLNLEKFDLTWQPGLKLSLSGRLAKLPTRPVGSVAGVVAADGQIAGRHLRELLSLVAGAQLQGGLLQRSAPLRVALDARFAVREKGRSATFDRIIADGTVGGDRVRIDARTRGAVANWAKQTAEVHGRIRGANALKTLRWMIGPPLGRNVTTDREPIAAPATVVMSTTGVPGTAMKAFVRIAAGKVLDADFSGDLKFADPKKLRPTWSGDLAIRNSTTEALLALGWPALRQHIASGPVRGRIAMAASNQGYRFKPDLEVAGTGLRGDLELKLASGRELPLISGQLAFSKTSLAGLSSIVLRPSSQPIVAGQWPDVPFDFGHLDKTKMDLRVSIGRVAFGTSGGKLLGTSFALKTDPNRIAIRDFSAHLGKARLRGSVDFKRWQAGAEVSAHLKGKGIVLARLAPQVAASNRLAGTTDFDLKFSGKALSLRSLSTVMAGGGEFRLKDVRVPGVTSETITAVSRKVINGELKVEALAAQLAALASQGRVELGDAVLKAHIADGTVALPSIVFELDEGALRNATFVDLPQWRVDSQWTVTPAPQARPALPGQFPGQSIALPSISLVYDGPVADLDTIVPKISHGDLERELIVRKMEANVARLEQLRREDEARAAAERERQRAIEEERRRSIAEELRRRQWNVRTQQQLPEVQRAPPGSQAGGPPEPSPASPPVARQ